MQQISYLVTGGAWKKASWNDILTAFKWCCEAAALLQLNVMKVRKKREWKQSVLLFSKSVGKRVGPWHVPE